MEEERNSQDKSEVIFLEEEQFELTEERNSQDKSEVIFLEEEQFELKCREYFNTQMATLAYMEGKQFKV